MKRLFESYLVLCISNFGMYQTHLQGLLKHRLLGLTLRISDMVGLG